jgi:glycosyltransferase involved in cell wall biosynthesis
MSMGAQMTGTPQDGLISIVMRTAGGRSRETVRALKSVAASTYRPVEVVVVYQGTEQAYGSFLTGCQALLADIPLRFTQNPTNEDRRAQNLNIGLENARGRYVAFLDDDDTIEPDHLELLAKALRDSGRAWAYSQVTLRREGDDPSEVSDSKPFWRRSFSVRALWEQNYIPIHSILIDRTRLAEELRERPFFEELNRSEDWDFLIRLSFCHEPAVVDAFTSIYYVGAGDKNTNISLVKQAAESDTFRQNRLAWEQCKALVEERKRALLQRTWWARDFFYPDAGNAVDAGGRNASARSRLDGRAFFRRIIRAIIRRLERHL